MLTYGRNAKMMLCVSMSQERHKPILGMFIFIMAVSPSNFAVVSFLFTSLRKGYFLRQRIRRYRFLKAGTAVLLDLNHPVIFRHEHPSILREAFLAMYRYVNVCKCKLISREHLWQILINNFIAVSLGKTNTCI